MINVQEKFVIWWELFYISSTLFVITTYVYVVLSINDKKMSGAVCVFKQSLKTPLPASVQGKLMST